MQTVEPTVRIIARTLPDDDAIVNMLVERGAEGFTRKRTFDGPEDVVEVAGRFCYDSFTAGRNKNVTKVREDQAGYIQNILKQAHGSVLEHVSWTFAFEDISRIVTHELVRHRPGTAVSQESLRYVRRDEFDMWFPGWALEDPFLMDHARDLLDQMEQFQELMTEHFDLDRPGQTFDYKKERTSFLRRFGPAGLATSMVWTANARALRHVIETRTAPGAEEEIRLVFTIVARMMREESPLLFGDFQEMPDGQQKPKWSKV